MSFATQSPSNFLGGGPTHEPTHDPANGFTGPIHNEDDLVSSSNGGNIHSFDWDIDDGVPRADLVSLEIPIAIVACVLYIFAGLAIHSYQQTHSGAVSIHESSVIVIVGVIMGFFVKLFTNHTVKFDNNLFFYMVLPPIIFSAGYCLKRKRFFQHIDLIVFFGVVGTISNFLLIAAGAYGYNRMWPHLASSADAATDSTTSTVSSSSSSMYSEEGFRLSWYEALIFASVLVGTDDVAAKSLVKIKDFPRMGALIFGEGVVNDALSIVLFRTFLPMYTQDMNIITTHQQLRHSTPSIVVILREIVGQLLFSCIIGTCCALVHARLMKVLQVTKQFPTYQTALVMLFGYLAYCIAEACEISGIMTVFVAAIAMAHYSWYNLASSARISTRIAFAAISEIAEGFSFAYVGLSLWGFEHNQMNLQFAFYMILVLLLSRLITVLGLFSICRLCIRSFNVPLAEQIGFLLGGFVRGALCWAQILQIGHSPVLITTTLILIMVSLIGSGVLLPLLLRRIKLAQQLQQQQQLAEKEGTAAGGSSSKQQLLVSANASRESMPLLALSRPQQSQQQLLQSERQPLIEMTHRNNQSHQHQKQQHDSDGFDDIEGFRDSNDNADVDNDDLRSAADAEELADDVMHYQRLVDSFRLSDTTALNAATPNRKVSPRVNGTATNNTAAAAAVKAGIAAAGADSGSQPDNASIRTSDSPMEQSNEPFTADPSQLMLHQAQKRYSQQQQQQQQGAMEVPTTIPPLPLRVKRNSTEPAFPSLHQQQQQQQPIDAYTAAYYGGGAVYYPLPPPMLPPAYNANPNLLPPHRQPQYLSPGSHEFEDDILPSNEALLAMANRSVQPQQPMYRYPYPPQKRQNPAATVGATGSSSNGSSGLLHSFGSQQQHHQQQPQQQQLSELKRSNSDEDITSELNVSVSSASTSRWKSNFMPDQTSAGRGVEIDTDSSIGGGGGNMKAGSNNNNNNNSDGRITLGRLAFWQWIRFDETFMKPMFGGSDRRLRTLRDQQAREAAIALMQRSHAAATVAASAEERPSQYHTQQPQSQQRYGSMADSRFSSVSVSPRAALTPHHHHQQQQRLSANSSFTFPAVAATSPSPSKVTKALDLDDDREEEFAMESVAKEICRLEDDAEEDTIGVVDDDDSQH